MPPTNEARITGPQFDGVAAAGTGRMELLPPLDPELDPFFQILARRVGPAIAGSFTPSQFSALKRAFGSRVIGAHSIDIRDSFSIFGISFYMVFLMGRDHRSQIRRRLEGPTGLERLVRIGLDMVWCGAVLAVGAIIVIACAATN
jgi:hypothetical protein